jgi:hypothetical protein
MAGVVSIAALPSYALLEFGFGLETGKVTVKYGDGQLLPVTAEGAFRGRHRQLFRPSFLHGRGDREYFTAARNDQRGLAPDVPFQHLAIPKRGERHSLAEIGPFDLCEYFAHGLPPACFVTLFKGGDIIRARCVDSAPFQRPHRL